MCKFLSAIVTNKEEIICMPEYTDSHEDLIDAHELNDNGTAFVRVEFAPENDGELAEIDKYKFKLDELARPKWFSPEMEARVAANLRERVSRMILIGVKRKLLLGGCWILKNCEIVIIQSARILLIIDAEITTVGGNAKITNMWNNAKITDVRDNVKIASVRDNAKILKDTRKKEALR